MKTLTGEYVKVYGPLQDWINEISHLTKPKEITIFLGSESEKQALFSVLTKNGIARPLNPLGHPHSYAAFSTPNDVARVEDKTFICCEHRDDAGPTNNWVQPSEMKAKLNVLFNGAMSGRVMYIIPFCMGHVESPYSRLGVEITDSAYVAANLSIMTRLGGNVLDKILNGAFVRCIHSVGVPLEPGEKDSPWPCNPSNLTIAHFPETMQVWSFGSGYGGNALLNKKCFALRLASWMARSEGWLAEHMLIIGVTNPEGKKRYFAASFPSSCGKTNLAMLNSPIPGWKVECVGDDIAWMFWNKETGKLMAINPEYGFFGVAPGTSWKTNPNAMSAIGKNTFFTNVGYTDDGDVWWEGIGEDPPASLKTWLHEIYMPGKNIAAHPNSRFSAPLSQCPSLDPAWNSPDGVPISGVIFGGRRATAVPLVRESLNWTQGVFFGASMTSETTAASSGETGKVRHDPFAMLPFCGYNMGDYFAHWLSMQDASGADGLKRELPRIFCVNWFLKNSEGRYLWPGFSYNMHIIKWMFQRLEGNTDEITTTPIGILPALSYFKNSEMVPQLNVADLELLLRVDPHLWRNELLRIEEYFDQFDEQHFPVLLKEELKRQIAQISSQGLKV